MTDTTRKPTLADMTRIFPANPLPSATVKPGTRCEGPQHARLLDEALAAYNEILNDRDRIGGTATGFDERNATRLVNSFDAVRMVTVPANNGPNVRPEWQARGYGAKKQVALCEPCAAYAERSK